MHVRRRAAAVIAATGLTAALLPLAAGSAQADPSGPSFGYITSVMSGAHKSTTDRLRFTTPGNLSASTTLTPNSYVRQYDVSEDGNVLLIAGQSRSLALSPLNSTVALTLTVRDPGTSAVTTKILTTDFEGNPALSRDGSTAFWHDGQYLHRYVIATGFEEATSRFEAYKRTIWDEEVRRIAVSPDGTKVAALIAKYDPDGFLLSTRVKAANFTNGVGTAYTEEVAFTLTSVYPVSQLLSWNADGTAFYYSREKPDLSVETVQATTAPDSDVVVPGWADAYDLTTVDGSFYLFRDIYDPAGDFVRSEVGSSATVDVPADWTTFPPGASSIRYRAATVLPPVLTTPTNPKTSVSTLYPIGTTISTSYPLRYVSKATYGARPTYYGDLSMSTNGGATYTKIATTSGATLTKASGSTYTNGVTRALTRNSLLKWCFLGDLYVKASCSKPVKITVNPVIKVGIEKSGTLQRVYGSAARVGGTVALQKIVSAGYTTVASATVSSTGRFSFGFKKLSPGIYQVRTPSDSSWGVGIKRIQIS
jgi:hypothetical protein